MLGQPTLLSEKMHTTVPAHHRATGTGLCAAQWCAAGLHAIRLGCVEGHPRYGEWQNCRYLGRLHIFFQCLQPGVESSIWINSRKRNDDSFDHHLFMGPLQKHHIQNKTSSAFIIFITVCLSLGTAFWIPNFSNVLLSWVQHNICCVYTVLYVTRYCLPASDSREFV